MNSGQKKNDARASKQPKPTEKIYIFEGYMRTLKGIDGAQQYIKSIRGKKDR